MDHIEAFLAGVTRWGRARPDVRAVLLIGSRARTAVPADRWSDVDLVLVVDDPRPYLADGGWLAAFGRPLLTFVEGTAVGGFRERRVLFEDGVEADFAFLPGAVAGSAAAPAPFPAELVDVLRRGFRVLVDKVRLAERLPTDGPDTTAALPVPGEIAELSHDFWYHLLWAAKKLRRGEVWIAKQSCDSYLKSLLVRLLAWHARAGDPHCDTWHAGRFIERWADPDALAALPATYARYQPADIARALWATADLFERVERQYAVRTGAPLAVAHQQLRRRLAEIIPADPPPRDREG